MHDSGNIYIHVCNYVQFTYPLLLPKIVKNADKALYIYIYIKLCPMFRKFRHL